MAKYHDRKKKTVLLEVNIIPNKRLFMVKYHDRKRKRALVEVDHALRCFQLLKDLEPEVITSHR